MAPVRSNRRSSGRAHPDSRICHLCYQRGHLAWECPARRALLTLVRLMPGLNIPLNADVRSRSPSRVNPRVFRHWEEARERNQYQSYRPQSRQYNSYRASLNSRVARSRDEEPRRRDRPENAVPVEVVRREQEAAYSSNENSTGVQSPSTIDLETRAASSMNASRASLECHMSTSTSENHVPGGSLEACDNTNDQRDTSDVPDIMDTMELNLDTALTAEDYCGNEFSIL